MIREIVRYGSKVLRRKALPVTSVDAEVNALIQDLFDTLAEADGVGLAAPQIGVSRRVIVVDISAAQADQPPMALVNPAIDAGEGTATAEEGCLSIPDLYGEVPRFTEVTISALDHEGCAFELAAQGFFARVLQHEIDHLDGRLFIDHMPPLKRQLLRGPLKRIRKEGEEWDRRHSSH